MVGLLTFGKLFDGYDWLRPQFDTFQTAIFEGQQPTELVRSQFVKPFFDWNVDPVHEKADTLVFGVRLSAAFENLDEREATLDEIFIAAHPGTGATGEADNEQGYET